MARTTPTPTFALGDTVTYLPTGWRYVICGADGFGNYLLESIEDAPNVWPWVRAEVLHRHGMPFPPRTKET